MIRSNSQRALERRERAGRLGNADALHREKTSALFQIELESQASAAGLTTREFIRNLSSSDYRALKAKKQRALQGR